MPRWALGVGPLVVVGALVAIFAALGAPGLGERLGPPVEEAIVERAVLEPGQIELTVRNEGPDPITVAQVVVNDAFVDFDADALEIGRLGTQRLTVPYDWVEGEAYDIGLLTSTGAVIEHQIPVAVPTPDPSGFLGLMALLGLYVGVIPVAIGMLWLPWLRRLPPEWMQAIMAVTVGLLLWLAIDAGLEGLEVAGAGAGAFGGAALVPLGALAAYGILTWVAETLKRRRAAAGESAGPTLALLIAAGIGLHNLGEGLAIGSAYAVGALALGASLVVGFAIHNTTEGLAIVAPIADRGAALRRLVLLGLLAGAPAILGAWIGAAAFNPAVAALLLGFGVGAIAQVVVQIAPSVRDSAGRFLHPAAVAGMLAGVGVMYATGLLV